MKFKKICYNFLYIEKKEKKKVKNLNYIFFFLKYQHFFKYYLNGFIKKGKKIFFFSLLNSIFFDFFFILRESANYYKIPYELKSIQASGKKYFNLNYFLNWLVEDYRYLYFSNLWKPRKARTKRKKQKQKKQKKYNALKSLLNKNDRWRFFFRVLFLKILNINTKNLKVRLLKVFWDLAINYKKSWLYLFKIEFYKKLLFS